MAKVTLTFEDKPDGTVKVESEPPANFLFARMKSMGRLTDGEAMACMAMLKVIGESKREEHKKRSILLPGEM